MDLGNVINHISPYTRVVTAITPFLGALVLRLVFGKNQFTRMALSVSTVWFAVNVFMAPYSHAMRQDLQNLQHAVFR
jgi:hypothetical protein